MKNIVLSAFLAVLAIGLSGCFGDTEQAEPSDSTSGSVEQPADNADNPTGEESSDEADKDSTAKKRPKEKTDTIELEGNKESFHFTLYSIPALQFSTYIPDDLVVTASEDGIFNVCANFAGKKNEDAKVVFYEPVKAAETTVEKQAEAMQQSLESKGFEVSQSTSDAPKRFALSEKEFHVVKQQDNGHILGTAMVFQHGDLVYRVLVQYPEEFEEGFVPRVVKMFEDIVWDDQASQK